MSGRAPAPVPASSPHTASFYPSSASSSSSSSNPSSLPQHSDPIYSELRYLHTKVDAIYNFQRTGTDLPGPCKKCEELKRRPEPTSCSFCERTNRELDRLKLEYNKVLCAKYTVDIEKMPKEEVGRGVQAVVYKMTLNRTEVAVKVLQDCAGLLDLEGDFTKSELFLPLYFRHPNLVEMYGFGVGASRFDKNLYVVMGLKDFSLDNFLVKAVERGMEVTPKIMVRMGRQMLSALIYLHANGVAHGQIMPENVLLERISSTRYKIVLSNFGISPKVDLYTRTRTTKDGGLGKFYPYISPEAFTGEEESQECLGKKDIYAFGITFWELVMSMWTLTATRYTFTCDKPNPFKILKLAEVNRPPLAQLPICCHEFFGRTWEGDVARRYNSTEAYDAITVIRDFAKSAPPPIPKAVPPPPSAPVPAPPSVSAPMLSPSKTSFATTSNATIQEQLRDAAQKREGTFKEPERRKPKGRLEGFIDRIMTMRSKMNESVDADEGDDEEDDDWI